MSALVPPFVDLDLRSYGERCGTDRHAFAQLVLPVSGVVEVEVLGRQAWLDPMRGAVVLAGPGVSPGTSGWLMLAGIVTGVAALCSVIGTGLWNAASRTLPLTMTGQLIVFETVFAVLYGGLWKQRWPTAAEGTALLLLLGGVALCARAHRPPHVAPPGRAGEPQRQPA